MTQITVTIDQKRIREIQRIFRDYPKQVPRLMRDSINRTAEKARKAIVDRLAAVNPGLIKKNIRKNTTISRATTSALQANVKVGGRKVPLINMGAKTGRRTKFVEIASVKRSVWLFYNVFKPKYGDMAIFSYHYKMKRQVHQNITYQDGRKTKSLAGTGAFVATMKSGHRGIFKRREGFGNKAIVEMTGPTIGQMLERSGLLLTRIEARAVKGLELEIDKRVKSYLERARARRTG